MHIYTHTLTRAKETQESRTNEKRRKSNITQTLDVFHLIFTIIEGKGDPEDGREQWWRWTSEQRNRMSNRVLSALTIVKETNFLPQFVCLLANHNTEGNILWIKGRKGQLLCCDLNTFVITHDNVDSVSVWVSLPVSAIVSISYYPLNQTCILSYCQSIICDFQEITWLVIGGVGICQLICLTTIIWNKCIFALLLSTCLPIRHPLVILF